ncbi:MAG: heat-inducible transcriptional repressor HrcA [candidate division Zixibacteria bacterium]|nr:heat-inducible transcriptional repressor HrcA [candidate division Zixibacteria bacterium]
MAFENLNARELSVLQNLVNHYIQTADPVGSRVIANKFRMGLSPATIRNTMQDLEELGLIRQPHTSAGRVPTDSGYRVFVDMLLKAEALTEAEKAQIKGMINSSNKGLDAILSQTSRILGEITNQLGITISPKFDEGILTKIDLIPVAEGKILVLVAVRSGLAKSILMELEADVELEELRQLEAILNERLAGLTLGHIRKTISERLADTNCSPRLLKLFIDSRAVIWGEQNDEKLHFTGTDKLISQPEFADRSKITEFFKFLEEQKALIEFVESKSPAEGLVITIGSENEINQIQDCSLVISRYKVGRVSGTIGIIGPTRMPYSKLVSIVEYTAKSLTEALSDL